MKVLLAQVLFWMGVKVLSSTTTTKLTVRIRAGGATIPANVYKVSENNL